MTPPSGEIVARPMLKRACGCVQEFQYYEVDKYRAQRQAKFESTRCPGCAAKLIESQRIPSKGEAFSLLPPGAKLLLERADDGTWSGELTALDVTVSTKDAALQSIIGALAQQWVMQSRLKNEHDQKA